MANPLLLQLWVLKREIRKATNLNPVRWRDMVVELPVVLNIVTKMKNSFKIILRFFTLLAFAASFVPSAYADSRSATVRISCTIMPVLEITLPTAKNSAPIASRPEIELQLTGPSVNVNTNLGKDYQLAENLTKTENALIRLYSVTAL